MEAPELIELDGLTLRRAVKGDGPMVASSVADNLERLAPWLPWATVESTDPAHQADRIVQTRARWADGSAYEYLAVDPASGAHLGNFGLERRVGPGAIELGYWLTATAEGRGLATAAAWALTTTALTLTGVQRVEIHCDETNLRSQAVPRRLGYRVDRVDRVEPRAPADTGRSMIWIFEPAAGY